MTHDDVFDLPPDHPMRHAHAHSIHHRTEVERSTSCGCFCCPSTAANQLAPKPGRYHQPADRAGEQGPFRQDRKNSLAGARRHPYGLGDVADDE
jgi:hypothetical protein